MIIGGGFGGLYCAESLRKAPVHVTLIDRRNFHLFQPLLYQVATGGLSPANIAAPLRAVLERHPNIAVLMAEVCGFDLAGRRVLLGDDSVAYDSLIVATGSETSYFGHDEWEPTAPGLKTIEEATNIRHRVLAAFETAERQRDADEVRRQLTFVVIGGGPTGVEMAGAVAEMARHTLRGEFRRIDPADARIFLIEGGDRLLNAFPPKLSARAQTQLEQLGVVVCLKTLATDVRADGVTIRCGEETEEIAAATLIWAAGVQASPLGKVLADAAGIQPDQQGRVPVGPDLSLPGHAEVFVIGDLARISPVSRRCAAAGACAGGDAGRALRGKTHPSPPAGARCRRFGIATAAPWPRSAAPGRSGCRPLEILRHVGLADVAFHPLGVYRRVRESAANLLPMGLELLHVESLGTADHRRSGKRGKHHAKAQRREGLKAAFPLRAFRLCVRS